MTDTYALLVSSLDVVGVYVFGVSGALVAARKRYDVIGILALAVASALGGGIMRDLLIGDVPPAGISNGWLLGTACLAGLSTYAAYRAVRSPERYRVEAISRLIVVLDAVGLATFAVSGSVKAVTRPGVPATAAVVVGVVTATGGGVIRDILAHREPELFLGEVYALAALPGAVIVVVAQRAGWLEPWVLVVAGVSVLIIRLASVKLGWRIPRARRRGDAA